MTNKEQLAQLSPPDWWARVDWLYHEYSRNYTDSRAAIMEWLEREYRCVHPLVMNGLEVCPECFQAVIVRSNKCTKCRTEWQKDA